MPFLSKLFGSRNKYAQDKAVVLPISVFCSNGKLEEHKLILQLDEQQINVQKKRGKCVVKSLGVSELQEVITGQLPKAIKSANAKNNKIQADCCVLLVANKTEDEVELVARTREAAQNVVELVRKMQRSYKSSVKDKLDDWILVYFNEADKSKNGTLSLDEICRVVQKLGCNLKREEIRVRFNAANRNADDSLNVEEFRLFFHDLLALAEIDSVFTHYGGDAFLDFGEFRTFLSNALGKSMLAATALQRFENVLAAYERSDEARKRSLLTNDGFRLMYVSGCPLVSVFNEQHAVVYQDMNRPLGDYWMDSSHNTYLEGRQVFGTSSADAYRQALRLGCRSVELDVWDGKEEPIITHGYTYTSHLLLSDALNAINETAFEKSPYPVVLSLENHMTVEYQKIAASLFKRIFGEKLYTTNHQTGTPLPSPEQLKYKIILKGKGLKQVSESAHDAKHQAADLDMNDDDDDGDANEGQPQEDASKRNANGEAQRGKGSKDLAVELGELIVLCKSVGFRGFEQAHKNQNACEMSSLVETKAVKLAEEDPKAFIRYSNAFMVRIYPKGTRVDSGNYDPVPFWNVGCQLVASNVQRQDEAFAIGRALFADNGGCGYVLKPPLLLQGLPDTPIELSVRVISGFQLPYLSDHLDPVVTVSISGVKADVARQSTSVVIRNSFHPVWNALFKFSISTPSLAFIRFVVHDDDDNEKRVCAQNAFRVINVASGFRALPLLDSSHRLDEKAFLFVEINAQPVISNQVTSSAL